MRSILTILILLALAFGSCTVYYFDKPQPIDADNTYKLPDKYTGSWYVRESPDEAVENWDSLSVARSSYNYVSREIFKAALSEVEADSSVFIVDDKIYLKEDGMLTSVYSYTTEADSMIIYLEDHNLVEFGPKVFLREIEYGYILNTRHEHLDNWWELKFLDTRDREQLIVRSIGDNDIKFLPPYKSLHEDLPDYIRASWTSEEIENFIDRGGFSNTLVTLVYSERLKD